MVSSTDFVRASERTTDCNIEPPASPYAIMRRVHPYRGENSGPGKDDHYPDPELENNIGTFETCRRY